mmetsp:Transcript_57395/g.115000  ORF Transcript_57395/g.115000 Transcript_57395/m.115000 type:complete len:362 (+) Transcript_57395:51-1136(+)
MLVLFDDSYDLVKTIDCWPVGLSTSKKFAHCMMRLLWAPYPSVEAHGVEPHGLEAGHEHGEDGAAAAEVHHLGPHAGVEAGEAPGLGEVRGLGEEGRGVVGLQGPGPGDAGVEGLGQRLLLHDGAADIGPAVQRGARGAGGEAREHVLRELVGDHGGRGALVDVQGEEEAAGPEELAHLHARVADHEAAEAPGLHDVLGDVRGAAELALLVQLRRELDVLQRRDGEDLGHRAQRARQALAHRRALGLRLAVELPVHDGLHEELDGARDRGARDLRHKALLHEAHDAVRLQEALERRARARPGVGHADGAHHVHGVHDDARDQRAAADRRQRVHTRGLALARLRHLRLALLRVACLRQLVAA